MHTHIHRWCCLEYERSKYSLIVRFTRTAWVLPVRSFARTGLFSRFTRSFVRSWVLPVQVFTHIVCSTGSHVRLLVHGYSSFMHLIFINVVARLWGMRIVCFGTLRAQLCSASPHIRSFVLFRLSIRSFVLFWLSILSFLVSRRNK